VEALSDKGGTLDEYASRLVREVELGSPSVDVDHCVRDSAADAGRPPLRIEVSAALRRMLEAWRAPGVRWFLEPAFELIGLTDVNAIAEIEPVNAWRRRSAWKDDSTRIQR
jgi:hypothetical protein